MAASNRVPNPKQLFSMPNTEYQTSAGQGSGKDADMPDLAAPATENRCADIEGRQDW
jgi:hypothetical protein